MKGASTRILGKCIALALIGVGFLACGSTGQGAQFGDGNNGNGDNNGDGSGNGGNSLLGGGSSDGGGGGIGTNGDGGPCVNLQCQQVACGGTAHTTVSGTVLDPAGKNPLYDVVVYVPNSPPQPFVDHATCDTCESLYTGNPIVTALTGPDGKFSLQDVPVGTNIPLVIQIGKWRRQITIPSVTKCVDNPITDPTQLNLPKNSSQGDIPKIAISTGASDTLECLLERMGVDEAEYGGGASGTGRIHIFQGNGNGVATTNTASQTGLWDSAADLTNYDIVMLSCEGGEDPNTKPAASLQAMEAYANAGGRVFASHFHYYWFEGAGSAPDFQDTATWFPGQNSIGPNSVTSAAINTSFPKGVAFNTWLGLTNALQADGTLSISDSRQNASVNQTVNTASQPWITDTTVPTVKGGGPTTMYFTFNTPTTTPVANQCGRVVFSDLHVGAASNDYSNGKKTVPEGCTVSDLSPQEKALEFMLFDLSSCVTPDSQPPTAPPGSGGVN